MWIHEHPRDQLGAQRVRLELELGHDAEVAPAAAQRPEQVCVLVAACPAGLAVGGHDLGRVEAVDRQPMAAHQPPRPAIERQPTDTSV